MLPAVLQRPGHGCANQCPLPPRFAGARSAPARGRDVPERGTGAVPDPRRLLDGVALTRGGGCRIRRSVLRAWRPGRSIARLREARRRRLSRPTGTSPTGPGVSAVASCSPRPEWIAPRTPTPRGAAGSASGPEITRQAPLEVTTLQKEVATPPGEGLRRIAVLTRFSLAGAESLREDARMDAPPPGRRAPRSTGPRSALPG
jgi:hypothetical protein